MEAQYKVPCEVLIKLSLTACSSFTGLSLTLLTIKYTIVSWPVEVQYFFGAFSLACELIIPTVQQLAIAAPPE